MAASSSPVKEGPRQLEVYIYWAESSGWVFVPRPSEKPERDPGLRVEAPASEPPAGAQGRYLLLDWSALDPALDDAFRAPGSAPGGTGGGARSAAAAVRKQDCRLRGLMSMVRQLEEKLRLKQEAEAEGLGRALRAEVEELKAKLEGERSRADMEKCRADQIQAELRHLEQATCFASKFQADVVAPSELEGCGVETKKARMQLDDAILNGLEKPTRSLQDLSQQVVEQERLAWMQTLQQDANGRCQAAKSDRLLFEAAQKCQADEQPPRLAEQELVTAQQDGVEQAREQSTERSAAGSGTSDEQALRLSQDRQPENLLRLLLDGFAASSPESSFQLPEEHLVEDAKRSRDSSVFKDQLRLLEAALAQKPDGQKHESGALPGAVEPADSVSSASKGVVGALLAIQGLQEAGEKRLASELQEQLGFRASRAMNLGSAGIHGKARSNEEKSALRREIPLAFALALVSVYCLLGSSARRRMQSTVASIRKEVQEVRQLLPSQERDLEKLEDKLRAIFHTYSIGSATEKSKALLVKEQHAVLEIIEELKRRFKARSKADCVGKMVDVSTKCYQAWETFEKHLLWSRRFCQLQRQGCPGPGDLRALFFAVLSDPEEEGGGLARELAAFVRQAACQREAGLPGSACTTGETGAAALPGPPPPKRARWRW